MKREKFLQVSKTAVLRHCEKGRSPDEAIRKWRYGWITAPSLGVRNDKYGKCQVARLVICQNSWSFLLPSGIL